MYFRNINAHFKQKLRTLKLFQNFLIIVGYKENPSAHNHNRFDSRLGWKGVEHKKWRPSFLFPSHTHYSHCHKRCVSDHLVQPVKSLYLCKYLFHINAAATFKTSVIFTAYLSIPELWLSQTLVQWGCKMQGWEGRGMKGDKSPDIIKI